jgi:hypothetical protein
MQKRARVDVEIATHQHRRLVPGRVLRDKLRQLLHLRGGIVNTPQNTGVIGFDLVNHGGWSKNGSIFSAPARSCSVRLRRRRAARSSLACGC